MAKYTLICDHSTIGAPMKSTMEFETDFLPEVLENFELFLRGAGFFFDGKVEINDEFAVNNIESNDIDFNIDLNEDDQAYFAFDQVVANHMEYLDGKRTDICPTCGLSSAVMQGQKCYEPACPKGLG